MKQQQPPPSAASNPSPPLPFAPNAVTTEQIQKYLDENKNLILAILENQTLGKLAESQQYQAVLQRNLMYLAAIADAQSPQNSTPPPSQMPLNPGAQQGNNSQKPQTPAPAPTPTPTPQQQQQGGYPIGKIPFQLNTMQSQDHHHQQQQQQQLMHMRSAQQQQQQQLMQQGQSGQNMQQQFQGQSGPNSHQNMQHGGHHHSNVGSFMGGGGGGGGGYNIVEGNNSSEGQGK